MSAFGDYNKDEVVRAIEYLAQAERERGRSAEDILEVLMEVSSYGIRRGMSELLERGHDHPAKRQSSAPNPSDQRAGDAPAQVQRVDGCEPSNGENK